jgi:hypothetical protein
VSPINFKLKATLRNESVATAKVDFGDYQILRWKPLQYQSVGAGFVAAEVANTGCTANDNKRKALQTLSRLGG